MMKRRGLFTSTISALLMGILGCGGEQRSGAAPADTTQSAVSDTSAAAAPDTAAADTAAARARDSAAGAPRRESTVTQRDTAPRVAAKPAPPRTPRPRPAAPSPASPSRPDTTAIADSAQPATTPPTGSDTTTARSQPAETTSAAPTAQANAPLRDPYHQAPRDTVSQQVYDGWKQFNLNCARCHGEDVQGTTIAPHLLVSLRPDGPINTKELFVQTVCAGRPAKGMPAWCALGMEMPTIEAIYSYVKGRSEAKIHPGRPASKAGG